MEEKSESILSNSSYVMRGGYGPNSYALISVFQGTIIEGSKVMVEEVITTMLDVEKLSSEPAFRIADLGCSSGPNAIVAIQNIVDVVERKFQSRGLITPELQVFFNDQVTNDFNSLFALLPSTPKYYAAGVPGSFHDRLFPKASLHFVYSSSALHWLSKVPERVAALNKGRIHYTDAPKEVFEAYSEQFSKDIDSFLKARAKEIAPSGLMALVIPAFPDVVALQVKLKTDIEPVESCLLDMAKMGIVSEEKVDAFNVPVYLTTPKELRQIIEGNGCFSIERMEILNNRKKHSVMPDIKQRVLSMRAIFEDLIGKHFGTEIVDQLFEIYATKLSESSTFLNQDGADNCQLKVSLFVLLKHNLN